MKNKKLYNKTICIDFKTESYYADCISNRDEFKAHLNRTYEKYSELFPQNMSEGWILNGYTRSKKQVVKCIESR